MRFCRSSVKHAWTLVSGSTGTPVRLPLLKQCFPRSRVLQPTWPVPRTCVTQTYASPGAVCSDIMAHLTHWRIYESIKALHKDEVLLCSPFSRLSPQSLGQIYVSTPGQEVEKKVLEDRIFEGSMKGSVFCPSSHVLLSTFMPLLTLDSGFHVQPLT